MARAAGEPFAQSFQDLYRLLQDADLRRGGTPGK